MIKRITYLPLIMLVLVNILPLFGVFWFDWDVAEVIVLYWAENLVVAFYTVVKIIMAPVERPSQHLPKLGTIIFFMLHYGGFVAIHGVFVLTFIGHDPDVYAGMDSFDYLGPFVFFVLLFNVIDNLIRVMPVHFLWPLAGLFISHGFSFIQIHIGRKEYLGKSPRKLMFEPYRRMAVMHIALIAAGVFVMKQGSPLPLLIILIALKIGLDMYLHFRSHRRTAYTGNTDPVAGES